MSCKCNWILRVEGVSFENTIYNTNDLSTIRGASLTLESYAYLLEDSLRKELGGLPDRIQRAGGIAIFRLENLDETCAEAIAAKVRAWLRESSGFPAAWPPFVWREYSGHGSADHGIRQFRRPPTEHMIFVTDIVPIGTIGTIAADVERVAINEALLRNRVRRMRGPDLPPAPGVTVGGTGAAERNAGKCLIDPCRMIPDNPESFVCVTPGQYRTKGMGLQQLRTCQRVADLRPYGHDAKRMIYPALIAEAAGKTAADGLVNRGLFGKYDFARHFDDIVKEPPNGLSPSAAGKLAVMHFDGSGFTDIRARSNYRKFAAAVETVNGRILERLVDWFLGGAEGMNRQRFVRPGQLVWRERWAERSRETADLLRVETLLLGGEDVTVVAPAWLGADFAWTMLEWFADEGGRCKTGLSVDLVWRGGLYICDERFPIRRATALAHALCDGAKQGYDGGPPQPSLQVFVAESHDVPEVSGMPSAGLDDLRCRLYGTGAARPWCLTGRDQIVTLRKLKAGLARGPMHDWIRRLDEAAPADRENLTKELLKTHAGRGRNETTPKKVLDGLPAAGEPLSLRLKVFADWWDYIDPFRETER